MVQTILARRCAVSGVSFVSQLESFEFILLQTSDQPALSGVMVTRFALQFRIGSEQISRESQRIEFRAHEYNE